MDLVTTMRFITSILITLLLCGKAPAQPLSESERTIPTDGNLVIRDLIWLKEQSCSTSKEGTFYFRVANRDFLTPVSEFSGALPKNIDARGSQNQPVELVIPRTSGCKSDPLPLHYVQLKIGPGISDVMEITETPEQSGGQPIVTRYIEHLRQTDACKAASTPNLTSCIGSRTDSATGKTIKIIFLIVTDPSKKMIVASSGIPIHAQCETDGQRSICFVRDNISDGATLKIILAMDRQITSEEIQRAHQRILDFSAERRP